MWNRAVPHGSLDRQPQILQRCATRQSKVAAVARSKKRKRLRIRRWAVLHGDRDVQWWTRHVGRSVCVRVRVHLRPSQPKAQAHLHVFVGISHLGLPHPQQLRLHEDIACVSAARITAKNKKGFAESSAELNQSKRMFTYYMVHAKLPSHRVTHSP